MKKRTKRALLVAAILAAVGAVCAVVALAAVDFRLSELSTVSDGPVEMVQETFDAEEVSEVVLEIQTDHVRLERSDDGQIHLEYAQRSRLPYRVSQNDGKLAVTQTRQRGLQFAVWFGKDDDFPVTLSLPEAYAGSVEIRSDLGGVETVQPVAIAGWFRCAIRAGTLDLAGLQASEVTLESDMGEIRGEDWEIGGSATVTVDAGSAILTGCRVGGVLRCSVDLGDVRLKATTAAEAVLSADTGSIFLDGLAAEELELETDLGSIQGTLYGEAADYTIAVETDLGSSNLKNQTGRTGKVLRASADTGDIELQFSGS